jgi:hypothetical protein
MTGGKCVVFGCYTPWDRVQAHHLHPLAEGGDPEGPGLPMCHTHHRLLTQRQAKLRLR